MKVKWSKIKPLLIILIPLLLLPLPLIEKDPVATYAYCLLIIALFWILDLVHLSVTSLLPMVLLPFAGVVSPSYLAKQYFPDLCMLFLGTMILACAVERTGVHRRLALYTLKICGSSLKSLMFGLMLSTWFLSMWISNSATTALMMPVVEAIFEVFKKYFGSQDDQNIENGMKIAVIPSAITKGLSLSIATAANLGGLVTLSGTPPNLVCANIMQEMFPCYTPKLSFANWLILGLPTSILLLIIMYFYHILYWFILVPKEEKKKNNKFGGETIREIINRQYDQLPDIQFNEIYVILTLIMMVVFWFFKSPNFINGWADLYPEGSPRPSDSTIALFFAILLFVVPNKFSSSGENYHLNTKNQKSCWSLFWFNLQNLNWKDPILTWEIFQAYCPWGIILLIGSGVALSGAAAQSGFSAWVAEKLNGLGNLSDSGILWICVILVALLTEITSNTATSNLILPILNSLSVTVGINPLYLSVAATMACSLAFMLPVATGPNAIVFSYKRIKMMDMIKCGAVLNLIGIVVIAVMGQIYFPVLLKSKNFDQNWINATAVC